MVWLLTRQADEGLHGLHRWQVKQKGRENVKGRGLAEGRCVNRGGVDGGYVLWRTLSSVLQAKGGLRGSEGLNGGNFKSRGRAGLQKNRMAGNDRGSNSPASYDLLKYTRHKPCSSTHQQHAAWGCHPVVFNIPFYHFLEMCLVTLN